MEHDNDREWSWLARAGPTWIVAGAIYLGWGVATWHYHALPWWLVLPIGGFLLAWHGSLQHEAVHGQLAPWRWLNDAIALPPLGLWLPFPIYRATHRAHHNFDILTGLSAALLGLALTRWWVPAWLVAVWNVGGLLLLLNVLTIALLSAPTAFRRFFNEPSNVWVTGAPWVWLPAVMVFAALLGHGLIFVRLARRLGASDATLVPRPG